MDHSWLSAALNSFHIKLIIITPAFFHLTLPYLPLFSFFSFFSTLALKHPSLSFLPLLSLKCPLTTSSNSNDNTSSFYGTNPNPPSSKLHNPSSISLENSPWTSHFYPSMFLSSIHPPRHFNLNHDDEEELDDQTSTLNALNPKPYPPENHQLGHETEPMFEKPLTPSDVGKLNRLVIPKQHAEKYFPLGSDASDKGLLLSFEDESGKCWRFRYSYWNSSQSYVLTKGWSRYVKEKQLDAGDIILFQRHRTDGDRLFIGWRRRGAAVVVAPAATDGGNAVMENYRGGGGGGNGGWSNRGLYQRYRHLGHIQGLGANVPYQPDCLHAGSIVQNQATAAGNPKRLVRLFGVNLECHQLDESPPSTPASSMVSSQGPTPHQFY